MYDEERRRSPFAYYAGAPSPHPPYHELAPSYPPFYAGPPPGFAAPYPYAAPPTFQYAHAPPPPPPHYAMAPVYYSPGPSYAPPQPVATYRPGPQPTLYAMPIGQPHAFGHGVRPSFAPDLPSGPNSAPVRSGEDPGASGSGVARDSRTKRSYRKKSAPAACAACGTSDTPEWRKGPTGNRTLSVLTFDRSY